MGYYLEEILERKSIKEEIDKQAEKQNIQPLLLLQEYLSAILEYTIPNRIITVDEISELLKMLIAVFTSISNV